MDREADSNRTKTHTPLAQGTMIGQYRIVEKIGAGGMGEVYLAEDSKLNRKVALKFLPAHLASDAAARARFTREAQAAAKLDHPNIVPIYEVGEFQQRPFFAMAHIGGTSLREAIGQGKLTAAESVRLTIQICEGLQKAHEAGIVHRDIKPSNIIIDESNRPRLLDFGLATISGEEKLTKTGSTLGTVGYMSPEQITGDKVDKRADIFSVGVILYEMITGRRPFQGDNDAAVVRAITDSTPEPIARFKSGTTGELQQVIDRAIAKDPSIRYQHADGMIADLKRLSMSSAEQPARKRLWWAAAAILIAAGVWGISMTTQDGPTQQAQVEQPVLVVLPFDNLGASDDEFFSNGIREEINSRLMTIKGLRLISPRSAEKYRDAERDFEQIGRETGADYVLEATIRWDKSGDVDRFRITPKLTKTDDGYLMWAENYDQNMVQVFEVQTDIADRIVTALGLTLLEPGQQAPDYAPTSNMEAYNYYLRGLDQLSQGIWLTDLPDAIAMFDSAVALDSSFAIAWAMQSVVHSQYEFGYIVDDNSSHARAAKRAAEKALEIDPTLAAGHVALGWYYNLMKGDYDRALAEFALAEREMTNNADLLEAIGVVKMRQGKWQESVDAFEESARADPLSVRRYYWLALVHSMLRQFDEADHYSNRGIALAPLDGDAVFYRVYLNLLQYGSVDSPDRSFEDIVGDVRVAEIATYELAPTYTPGLWRFLIDRVEPDQMIADVYSLRGHRSPFMIHLNVGQIFDLSGQQDSAWVHYDSAKILLSKYVKQGTDDFHVYAPLGLTYAFLGVADSAIWAGRTAKELMPVDECHL